MDIVRQLFAILFVFAVLWFALGFLRKKSWTGMGRSRGQSGLLESRARLALTPRHSVHLVRIGDRNLVLALHPDGLTFLGDAACAAVSRECPGRAVK
jgi:flagellar biogenesis protein FliO